MFIYFFVIFVIPVKINLAFGICNAMSVATIAVDNFLGCLALSLASIRNIASSGICKRNKLTKL